MPTPVALPAPDWRQYQPLWETSWSVDGRCSQMHASLDDDACINQASVLCAFNTQDAALTGLPCREMCEAVTSRCSCSPSNETLGSLISWLSSKPGLKGTDLPVSYGRVLFKKLWDRPFCSIFPPSSTPGFAGRCDTVGNPGGSMTPGGYCSLPTAWCKASSNADTMRYIQSLLLLQTLRVSAVCC